MTTYPSKDAQFARLALLMMVGPMLLIAPRPSACQESDPFARTALYFSMGHDGDFLTAGFGARWRHFGLEFGAIGDRDIDENDIVDTEIPHTDYTDLGWLKSFSTIGVDGYVGFQPLRRCSIYAGAGLYMESLMRVARSNVTGWRWNQGEDTVTLGAVSAGVHLATSNHLLIGGGYHSLRGIQGTIGYRF